MKSFKILLLLVALATTAKAQNTLLWKVSGNGLQEPSYLYGTFHSMDERAHRFGDSVLVCLLRCDAFVGEITNMQANVDPAQAMKMAMMEDQTLEDLLNKREYKRVMAYISDKLGFLAFATKRMKPMMTMTLLSMTTYSSEMPYTVDDYLEKLARSKGLNIISLESVDEQVEAFNKVPLKEQAKMLVDFVDNDKQSRQDAEDMITMYSRQELDVLYNWYRENDVNSSDGFDQELVLKRNEIMAHRMDSLLKDQALFVGVGSLHLPGETGLIGLLRKRGYTVEPVFSEYHEGNRMEIENEEVIPFGEPLKVHPDDLPKLEE